jgi:putative membrane protein
MRVVRRSVLVAFAAASLTLTGFTAHAAATRGKATPALTDANIAAIVVAANTIDIDNAHVALEKSSNESVKAFAQQMVTDHTSVNEKATALATRLSLTPRPNGTSRSLLSSSKAKRARLARLAGAAFDKAYLDNEITYHQAVIDMLRDKLVPGAENTELKDLLTSVQPAFDAHLAHAKETRAALKE